MYNYREKRTISIGSLFFIILFVFVFIGAAVLLYIDKGRFWDWLPLACIASAVINLVLLIVYFVKKSVAGYIFTIFFIIFLAGIVLSSFFGPFALNSRARDAYENKNYLKAAQGFEKILEEYPSSRYSKDLLKDIAYAYYLHGDMEKSISYFQDAVSKQIIDPEDFENVKLFADIYAKLAENYASEKKYGLSADNYLKSVSYFEFISENFPDTNEAFVAKYKIPEYLYKAASDFSREKIWDRSFEALEKVVNNYPDSEYYALSNDMLFGLNVSKAIDLKSSGSYQESIESLLNVLDLPEEVLKDKRGQLIFQKESLLQGISVNVLIKSADTFFANSRCDKALFLYEYIFKKYPQSQDAITRNYVECKIKINSALEYERIVQGEPYARIKKEGFARISFENKTDYGLSIYIAGPDYKILLIDAQQKLEIDLPAGDYTATAELSATGSRPFYGKLVYEDGGRYREIFQPAEEKDES